MRRAILTNRLNGVQVLVHATTEHVDSHYGQPVWVDDDGIAYTQCDLSFDNLFYDIKEI